MGNKPDITDVMAEDIRNISIISHVDHGKTTLSDYLLASGGYLPEYLAGSMRALDSLPEEQRRGITIETSLSSYIIINENKKYLINLIDTPGHVDFSGKVAESLRLVDGSLIIIDAVEGVMAQTKSVLRQAIAEKIEFILFINKIDRLIKELELNTAKIQERIQKIVSDIQSLCINYGLKIDLIPNFTKGTILLGSALDGWAIDINFVKNGKNISTIIQAYHDKTFQIHDNIKLSKVVNNAIISKFPHPTKGQINKFPSLFLNQISSQLLQIMRRNSIQDKTILLIGRQEPISSKQMKNTFIVRVISGQVKKGDELIISTGSRLVKVNRIAQIFGRSRYTVNSLDTGNIGSISFSSHLTSGEIAQEPKFQENIKLKRISYIQDPVVSIGIEPLKIAQIGKLHHIIEEITQYTPGLYYEVNKLTGELIVLGVGTLQLDVLVNDLRAMDYEIEVSKPIIISYEVPLIKCSSIIDEYNLRYLAGPTDQVKIDTKFVLIYSDDNHNVVLCQRAINSDAQEGLIQVLFQSMKVSPISKKRIKNLSIIILNEELDENFTTYERAMISGNKIIKHALTSTNALIHEPYYEIEIYLPESYIGVIIQELQRMHSNIQDVISEGENSAIYGVIPVREAIYLADKLRQISDGNAFWSFPKVLFLPINSI
ncbi:MAG: GTP-binding protein [Candidatus Heimdallarchaeota archaeon]|nr:GTP-binding protein [Candidatus Heimdallarchaeota archaeon]